MFRTIRMKLPYHSAIEEIAMQFKDAVQIVLNYGFEYKTFNKNILNKGTYRKVREELRLTSALAQIERYTASESLKSTRLEKRIKKKPLTMRYLRTFKFYPYSHTISITTVQGRLVFPVSHTPIIDKYRGKYTNAELVIDKKNRIFVMFHLEHKKEVTNKNIDINIIGIDRGIKDIAVLSNNKFFNGMHLREVKGRCQYLKRKLQHLGTRFAKRKLRKIAGRESVSLHDMIALEALEPAKMKINVKGKKFKRKLGLFSKVELEKSIKNKAEELYKLNAPSNIEVLSKYEHITLLSTNCCAERKPHSWVGRSPVARF